MCPWHCFNQPPIWYQSYVIALIHVPNWVKDTGLSGSPQTNHSFSREEPNVLCHSKQGEGWDKGEQNIMNYHTCLSVAFSCLGIGLVAYLLNWFLRFTKLFSPHVYLMCTGGIKALSSIVCPILLTSLCCLFLHLCLKSVGHICVDFFCYFFQFHWVICVFLH